MATGGRSILAVSTFSIGYYAASKTSAPPTSATILGEPVVMRTKGGLLEVSKVVATESITQKFPGLFVDTVVTITVPATYRYHVELALEWKFMRQDNMFIVVSPPIRPSIPVAIDTQHMTINATQPFSGNDKLEAIEQITPLLNQKFLAYMPRQREEARKTIAEFVRKWVLDQEKWKDVKDLSMVVLFPDEPVNEVLKAGLYPVPIPKEVLSPKK